MRISEFYENTLGANLVNSRWSWGAYNPGTGQLFLRVWDDGLRVNGKDEMIHILDQSRKSKSPGFPERKRHVEELINGVEGYGVLCVAAKKGAKTRVIREFDQDVLLKFGDIIKKRKNVYARIIDRVPVENLSRRQTGNSTLSIDIKKILKQKSNNDTAKERMIDARVGQGLFSLQVLHSWNNQCCVTGTKTLEAIRASHIKPWKDSGNVERLDPDNGLPLIATLDALFDAGLITFKNDGKMVISTKVSSQEIRILGLNGLSLNKKPNNKIKK